MVEETVYITEEIFNPLTMYNKIKNNSEIESINKY